RHRAPEDELPGVVELERGDEAREEGAEDREPREALARLLAGRHEVEEERRARDGDEDALGAEGSRAFDRGRDRVLPVDGELEHGSASQCPLRRTMPRIVSVAASS